MKTLKTLLLILTIIPFSAGAVPVSLEKVGTYEYLRYIGDSLGIGTTTPTYKLTVGGDINFTGSLYQNGTLFTSGGASLSTSTIRSMFSNSATGLTYNGTTGDTSLTAGYIIPLSASTTEWSSFYNTPSTRIIAGANCSWVVNTFNCAGGSGGGATTTINGINGPTFTFATSTGLLITGAGSTLTFGAMTGFVIPLTASTTNWNTFYDTPSNRITAGTGLSWTGNTVNNTGVLSIGGLTGAVSTSSLGITSSQWTTNGSSIHYTAGSVAIGTTTVNEKLVVDGGATDTKFEVRASGSNVVGFRLKNVTRSYLFQNIGTQFRVVDETSATSPWSIDTSNNMYANGLRINGADTTNTIYQPSGGVVISSTAGNVVGLGDSTNGSILNVKSGLVGIGTSTPSSKLDIYATAGCAGMPFRISSSTNVSLLEVECNGNVAIGTTTPLSLLDVFGTFRVGTSTIPLIFANTANGFVGINKLVPTVALDVVGSIVSTSNITSGNNILLPAAGVLQFTIRSQITSPSSGTLLLRDSAGTGFNRLQFGGTTASFASIKASTTMIEFRLADDSAYATTTSSGGIFNGFVGIGTTTPDKLLTVTGDQAGAIMKVERVNSATTTVLGTAIFKGRSTGVLGVGSGVAVTFALQGSSTAENILGTIQAIRNGADNTGALRLAPYTAGSLTWAGLYIDGLNFTTSIGTALSGATLGVVGNATKPTTDLLSIASSSLEVFLSIKPTGFVGVATNTPNSSFNVDGSFSTRYRATSTAGTLLATDHIVDITTGTFAVTLPTAVGIQGRQYVIKNSGTGVVTINTTSAQIIDGSASGVLTLNQYAVLRVVSNGVNFIII